MPEYRRGHGAVYDALNAGRVSIGRLRRALAGLPLPAWPDGRIRLAADVSNWLRPDAETSPERLFCQRTRGEGERGADDPGLAVLVRGRAGAGGTSWTLPLDAVRLGPDDDETEVTAAQLREVVARLIAAGHWTPGDPDIVIALDAGYDLTRLAWLLADLPVELVARAAGQTGCSTACPAPGRPARRAARPRHGTPGRCDDPADLAGPAGRRTAHRDRPVRHRDGDGLGTGCTSGSPSRDGWQDHDGRAARHRGHPDPAARSITAARLPRRWSRCGCGPPRAGATAEEVNRPWQAFLRRFDLETSKPQCCHSRGSSALSSVPSRSVFMMAA